MNRAFLLGAAAMLATAAPAMACDLTISSVVKLSICIEPGEWEKQAVTPPQEFFYITPDQTVALMVLTEQGTAAVSDYRAAILQNAKNGSSSGEVDVKGERVENLGGKPWNVIEYDVPGLGLGFENFYYVAPGFGAVQLITWAATKDATLAAYEAGKVFSTVQFTN
jgi:hypothetical protein